VTPRAHNLTSYGLSLVVFAAVALWRIAGKTTAPPLAALAGAAMWCLHFARRSAEAAWVHHYGKPSVPVGDLVTEYAYYWGFAAWNAAALFAPSYRGPSGPFVAVGSLVFVLAALCNARAHLILRALRTPGSSARTIPRGFLFERVSCPHYLFEILTWVGFTVATQTWAALSFLLLASGILAGWARTRHLAYRRDFDGKEGRELYPPSRRALIPGLF